MTVTVALRHRPVGVADLADVIGILAVCDVAVLGRTDFSAAEVEVDLRNADMQHEGWYDDAGALVAYGWVMRESNKVVLDAYVLPTAEPALGVQVLASLEARGRQIVAAAGHDEVVFDIGAYRQDGRTRGWLAERGFEVGTTFTRMRIDLDGPDAPDAPAAPAAPAAPVATAPASAGVVLRRSDDSDDDLRVAYGIREESFAEHYGHVATGFDAWRKRYEEHGDGWCELWLAELQGVPVGMLVGTEQFVEDEDAGYVRTLGVVPASRGHGVAKALLRQYFSTQRAAGRSAVLLHVDVANVTGALAVYESVGMRPVLEIDAWLKRAPVDRLDSDTPL